tara:strand:+ start:5928 stop:6872 length:945 start_codon:yes stop_codon:yes gene_type:complete
MSEFHISKEDWNKIQGYAAIAYDVKKCEIGGMMVMHKTDDGDWLMHDPVILKQEIAYTECDIDKEALAVYYNDAMAKHPGCRFVWWHSHHNMKAFWSKTDENTIDGTKSADFTVSLVINLKGQYMLRVKWFQPTEAHIDTDLEIIHSIGDDVNPEMLKEVEALCNERKKVTTVGYGSYINRYNHTDGWGNQTTFLKTEKKSNDDTIDVEKALEIPDATFAPEQNDQILLTRITDFVDDINSKFCAREIQYKDWREYVRKANAQLSDTKWSLIEYKAQKLETLCLHAFPNEFIRWDNKPIPVHLGNNDNLDGWYL